MSLPASERKVKQLSLLPQYRSFITVVDMIEIISHVITLTGLAVRYGKRTCTAASSSQCKTLPSLSRHAWTAAIAWCELELERAAAAAAAAATTARAITDTSVQLEPFTYVRARSWLLKRLAMAPASDWLNSYSIRHPDGLAASSDFRISGD